MDVKLFDPVKDMLKGISKENIEREVEYEKIHDFLEILDKRTTYCSTLRLFILKLIKKLIWCVM
jgi:hypothetical protein